jgi:hypothetical protein
MLWTFYTTTISHDNLQSAGAIGAVTLTVNIPPVAGKLPNFNIVKMLISPPYPGGRGFNWLVHNNVIYVYNKNYKQYIYTRYTYTITKAIITGTTMRYLSRVSIYV